MAYIEFKNVIKEYILKSDTNHNALQIELSKARLVNDEILYRHLADFCLLKYRFMQISEVDLDLEYFQSKIMRKK